MHKIHCWWKDESARKRIGYPLSYAKAKKSLTLHAHGHFRTSLRDFYSSPLIIANLPHSVCYRNHMSHLANLWLSVWMYTATHDSLLRSMMMHVSHSYKAA